MAMFETEIRVQFNAENDLDAHAFSVKLHRLLMLAPDVEFVSKGVPREMPSYPEGFWTDVRGGKETSEDIERLMRNNRRPGA